jgi:O-methyltransferase involved in polyketide biosynthesis
VTDKIKIELGDIQKTLLLPLWGRAVESSKSSPLLLDQAAVRIIESIDYDFSKFYQGLSVISQLGWVVRSVLLDEIIKRFIAVHQEGTIVDIGCGLDTTFERVDNGTIRWYDLDLPDTIELRKKFFKESERRKFIVSSFLDPDWLNTLEITDNVLFVSAGLLYYFKEEQIRLFFRKIASMFPGSELAFDASSPFGVKMANKMVLKKGGMDEKSILKWGIKNSKEIELWDDRIEVISEIPFFKTIRTGKRLKTRILLSFSDITRIQLMIHVKIKK